MKGYTENRVVVMCDYDHVFDLSNRIDLWPKLFTEYSDAEILEQTETDIRFRLTTFPEGERPSRSWVSTRHLDKENGIATAERIEPKFPFKYMNIRWEYEKLPGDIGVIMTWIQEFDVADDCKFNVAQMEQFLNRNTHKQIKCVKKVIEAWVEIPEEETVVV